MMAIGSPAKANKSAGGGQSHARAMAHSIRILSPLVIAAGQSGCEDLEQRLLEDMEKLRHITDETQSTINIPDDDPHINDLTEALSHLLSKIDQKPIADEDIAIILDAACEMAESLPDIPDTQESLPLMVKSALFVPIVKLSFSLSGLEMSGGSIREEIRTITESAISLASTLAFHWSKKSNVDEAREQLFVTVLPAALTLTEQAWFEVASKHFASRDWSPAQSAKQNYPALERALQDYDMGWSEVPGGINSVLDRIASRLDAAVGWRAPSSWPAGFRGSIAGALAEQLETRAIASWQIAGERLATEVEAMNEQEVEAFASAEGAEPMRIERFDEVFRELLESSPLLDTPVLDPAEIVRIARQKLAFLWGISDAACQTRMVSKL